jgi:hypothetical protein
VLGLILSASIPPSAWLVFVVGLLLLAAVALAIAGVAVFAQTDTATHRIGCIIHGPPAPTSGEHHDAVEAAADTAAVRALATSTASAADTRSERPQLGHG